MITDNSYRIEEAWLDNAEKLFSFAETAKKRFESGNLIEKREILTCLGSNLILMGKKLNIQLQESLSIFTKYVPKIKVFHNRLEPLQDQTNLEVMEVLYAVNEIMGGRRDSNPRPSEPQSDALTS